MRMLNSFEEISQPSSKRDKTWPAPRSGHRICVTSNYIYLFGGYNNNNGHKLNNELWRYNITTQCWMKLPDQEGLCPNECASSSMLLWRNKIIVFGGTGYPFGSSNSNKLFMYCLDRYRWVNLDILLTSQRNETTSKECGCIVIKFARPEPRYGQSMAITSENKLLIFSGTSGNLFYDDLHEFDLETHIWTKIELCDKHNMHVPESCYRHESIIWNNKYFVFGGVAQNEEDHYYFQKVPYLDLVKYSWNSINPCAQSSTQGHVDFPLGRKAHSCVLYNDKVFILGGIFGQLYQFKDFWFFDLKKLCWTSYYMWFPHEIYFHSAAVTPQGCMFVYGGVDRSSKRSSKLHQIWLKTPSLMEQCWEKIVKCLKSNNSLHKQTLVELGIPKRFIARIDDSFKYLGKCL